MWKILFNVKDSTLNMNVYRCNFKLFVKQNFYIQYYFCTTIGFYKKKKHVL